ncbi:archaetidylserine decarboxylase [Reinekea sp. G2M2-21]|uniref:archaetidylserine decarboxylase n=1 Tax=Reinekea sp. G2M2-21 TaxID=2788942 RepID=UPI0018AB6CAA|nr:archaetidylserine decarboxylase [Reinekea sp. G2M2-21]
MKQTLQDFLFLALQYLLPHHLLSRLVGVLAESEWSIIKIPLMRFFLKRFGIDLSEAERERLEDYRNFNDFFTRALKPGRRPQQGTENSWTSPVDACVSQFGRMQGDQLIQAKGKTFTLPALLGGDQGMAQHYQDGEFITLYLSPKDYHRIHMPMKATLVKTTFIPGKLFSVNPLTAGHVDRLFARNERLVCEFESDQGRFLMVLVGAMIVASIETTWSGIVAPFERKIIQQSITASQLDFNRGEEMGRFRLGSTVIMVFEPGKMSWNEQIKIGANLQLGQLLSQ